MSEKQAKKERKESAPEAIGQIQATFFDDGGIIVEGVPADLDLATKWGFEIQRSIFKKFVNMAMEGKLAKKPSIIKTASMPNMNHTAQALMAAANKRIKAGLN